MSKRTVTSADVAREAGVSRATVSAVLNHSKYVSPELAERVNAAVNRLGYRTNALARSLKMSRTQTVGVMVPSILAHFLAELVVAAEEALDLCGYRILLSHSSENPERERRQLELMQERRVDGLLLVPASDANRAALAELVREIPTVVLDRRLAELGVDTVATDNAGGGYQAAVHLHGLGYRQIGAITFDTAARSSRERLEGFRRALADLQLPVRPEWIQVAPFPLHRSVREITLGMLRATPRPEALLVGDPLTLMHLWSALDETGLQVPGDLALVSFDEFPWAAHLRPPLTVLAQDAGEMARRGVELLMERLNGAPQRPPAEVLLPARLIARESCGAQLHSRRP